MDSEVKVNLPEEPRGKLDGVMQIAVKTERGHTITKGHGFTIVEEGDKVLAFDLLEHPQLGTTVLFGNQVFALRFWDDEDLDKGLEIITEGVRREKERRSSGT